jgi:hypothetical protein
VAGIRPAPGLAQTGKKSGFVKRADFHDGDEAAGPQAGDAGMAIVSDQPASSGFSAARSCPGDVGHPTQAKQSTDKATMPIALVRSAAARTSRIVLI